jgi:hypothetical protein
MLIAEGQAQPLEEVEQKDLAQELGCRVHLCLVYALRPLQVKRQRFANPAQRLKPDTSFCAPARLKACPD